MREIVWGRGDCVISPGKRGRFRRVERRSGSIAGSWSACCCSVEKRLAAPVLTIFSGILVWSFKHCNASCCKIPGEVIAGSVHVGLWDLLGSYFGGQFLFFFTSLAYGGAMCGIEVTVLWS